MTSMSLLHLAVYNLLKNLKVPVGKKLLIMMSTDKDGSTRVLIEEREE